MPLCSSWLYGLWFCGMQLRGLRLYALAVPLAHAFGNLAVHAALLVPPCAPGQMRLRLARNPLRGESAVIDADQQLCRLQRLIHELSGTGAQRPVLLDAGH